ncbi:unnamed protein product, partial [Medioppia subpectinata]
MEASKVLHLALQQMDGIIASCDSLMSPDINQLNDSSAFHFNTFSLNTNTLQTDNKSNHNIVVDKESRRLLIDLLLKYLNTSSPTVAPEESPLNA